jgi:hypothetical protein
VGAGGGREVGKKGGDGVRGKKWLNERGARCGGGKGREVGGERGVG